MIKSIETADHFLKLILASAVVIGYAFRVITGPFATALFILASVVLLYFFAKAVITIVTPRD